MGDLLVKFQQQVKKEYPFLQPANSQLLLAVSGGLDSIVLTHLFVQSGYKVVVAHCNFKLRGQESDRDEQFVRQLATKYNIPLHVKHFETEAYAQQHKVSIQEAARNLRYGWFQALVGNNEWSMVNGENVHGPLSIVHSKKSEQVGGDKFVEGGNAEDNIPSTIDDSPFTIHHSQFTIPDSRFTSDNSRFTSDNSSFTSHDSRFTFYDSRLKPPQFIITAHHANDTIETLLINLFRGTGISGLHGIPARQGNVLRPLLFAKRDEILAYAQASGLEWVEDSSNAVDKYTRNFIRLQLLPAAKEVFSQAEDNLLQNIERFKEAELLYNQAVNLHKSKLLEKKGNEWHIPVLKLQKLTPLHTLVWEVIKNFGFNAAQVPEIIKLLSAGNGSYVASPTNRIIKNRNWLIIAPLQAGEAHNIIIEQGEKQVVFEGGVLEIKYIKDSPLTIHHSPFTIADSRFTIHLDASQIKFPLLLRKWKQGDYFYPLGMQKKKKLGKFFIDQKLSKTAKEKAWVLECDKKIVWVVGMRIDDRFKITPATKQSLSIRFAANESTI